MLGRRVDSFVLQPPLNFRIWLGVLMRLFGFLMLWIIIVKFCSISQALNCPTIYFADHRLQGTVTFEKPVAFT